MMNSKRNLDRILGLTGGVSTSTAESVAEDLDEVPWSNTTDTTAGEPVVASRINTRKREWRGCDGLLQEILED